MGVSGKNNRMVHEDEKMTPDEFISSASSLGYCSKKAAEQYTVGRDNLTEDDYTEVYRIYQRQLDIKDGRVDQGKFRNYCGAKTTKRLAREGE